jgi:glucose-fructose oxidoreductase
MIAYRLHFEEANLKALEMVQQGQIGEPRFFSSEFSMQVKDGNIRLDEELGGGTLYDIGIYCINAARMHFRAEPVEVYAYTACGTERRFDEVDEMTGALLKFPGNRLATFVSSFGAADVSSYRIVGTESDLRVEPAYEYAGRLALYHTVNGKPRKQSFARRDQFAAELTYFSQCINEGRDPEPSGKEGMADVRIIEALYRSAEIGHPVPVASVGDLERPSPEQEIQHPPVSKPELVHAESPH